MKSLRTFYHFLGGVKLAIVLITMTAAFVIAGTFLESLTDSHRYAASFTYGSPLFTLLLALFFVNILVAALRRWPFKRRHIPFLITHLGLLMLLAGAIGKQIWGVQGTMSLVEGAGSQKILVSDSLAIEVKGHHLHTYLPLVPGQTSRGPGGLQIECTECRSNSHEHLELWIKGSHAYINGLSPIPVISWNQHDPLSLPVTARVGEQETWAFQAFRASDLAALAHDTYRQGTTLKAIDAHSQLPLGHVPLENALTNEFFFARGRATTHLDLDYSSITGFGNPKLVLNVNLVGHAPETIEIALNGPQALLNQNLSNRLLGSLPVQFELERQATVTVIADAFNDNHLWSFDPHGLIGNEAFRAQALDHLISYADGFGGYAIESHVVPPLVPRGRIDRERAYQRQMSEALRQGFQTPEALITPLQLWVDASSRLGVDPANTFVELLVAWNTTHQWLHPSDAALPNSVATVINALDWASAPHEDLNACWWATKAVDKAMPHLQTDLFNLRHQLPPAPIEISKDVTLFTSYLRFYGIHFQELAAMPDEAQLWTLLDAAPHTVCLECPVSRYHTTRPPDGKLEDNLPLAVMTISDGVSQEKVPLTFDRFGSGMRWPILKGRYLVRFQPLTQEIPYRVRLHEARQVNYPNGAQPFSYEARITVTDRRHLNAEEVELSMNKVHETWDGYRFYLANISPGNETSVRQVQLVVNHDPYKYWLTYPGAIALSLGILLLFGFRRSSS